MDKEPIKKHNKIVLGPEKKTGFNPDVLHLESNTSIE
jgi:hypothetical protein